MNGIAGRDVKLQNHASQNNQIQMRLFYSTIYEHYIQAQNELQNKARLNSNKILLKFICYLYLSIKIVDYYLTAPLT